MTCPERAGGLITGLARHALGFLALWAVLAAWWWSAPVLLRTELPDWGTDYADAWLGRDPGWLRDQEVNLPLWLWIEKKCGQDQDLEMRDWDLLWGGGPPREGVFERGDEAFALGLGLLGDQPVRCLRSPPGDETRWAWLHAEHPGDPGYDRQPARLRHPLRRLWPLLVGLAAAALFLLSWPASRGYLGRSWVGGMVKTGACCLSGAVAAVLLAWQTGTDLRFSLILGAIVGGVLGLLCLLMVLRHVILLRPLFSGRDLLAHWSLDEDGPGENGPDGESAASRRSGKRRRLAGLLALAALALGSAAAALTVRPGSWPAAALPWGLGLAALLALDGILRLREPPLEPPPREVFIGTRGMWAAGELHVWDTLFNRLEAVELTNGDRPGLRITYSALRSAGGPHFPFYFARFRYTATVPVPRGRLEEARALAQRLGGRMDRE